ncbi:MAG TPA: hypothetical protein DCX95_03835 [Elusimicrobia bacterium]|nr:hypothetical protein [Elusimicrobiota bacterium]
MKYKNIVIAAGQIIITAVLLYVIFSKIKPETVLRCFRHIDVRLLLAVSVLSVANHFFLMTFRYRAIIQMVGMKLPVFVSRIAKFGAIPLGIVLPFKTGKILRVFYLKNMGLPYHSGIISVFLELLVSGCALLCVFFFGLKIWSGLLFLILILVVSRNFNNSFPVFLWSIAYEIIRILCVFLLFFSFGINLSLENILVKIPVMLFIAGLPVTVSGFGAREFSAVVLFSDIAVREQIFSAAITLSFVEFLIPGIMGLFFIKKFLKGIIEK